MRASNITFIAEIYFIPNSNLNRNIPHKSQKYGYHNEEISKNRSIVSGTLGCNKIGGSGACTALGCGCFY